MPEDRLASVVVGCPLNNDWCTNGLARQVPNLQYDPLTTLLYPFISNFCSTLTLTLTLIQAAIRSIQVDIYIWAFGQLPTPRSCRLKAVTSASDKTNCE